MRDAGRASGNVAWGAGSGQTSGRGEHSGGGDEAATRERAFFSRQSVTLEQLRSFRRLFRRLEGRSKVDERTFVALVSQVLGSSFSRATMQQLFMKIDANSDGDLTWDEFVDYLFFSQQDTLFGGEGANEPLFKLLPCEAMEDGAAYTERLLRAETQVGMDYFPSLSAFVSWSREGTVRLWSPTTLELQCTLHTTTDGSEDWITDVAHMSQSGKLAIASLKSCITLVDMGNEYKKVYGRIHQREFHQASPLCLEYAYLAKPAPVAHGSAGSADNEDGVGEGGGRELLFVGDDAGVVTICEFPARTWSVGDFFSLHGVKGRRIRRFRKHRDHVTKVAYIEELELLLTASLDSDMYALDVEKNTVRTSFTRHTKAIYDFQWISSAKVVASCGLQADIYLWSPYSAAAFQRLTGHTSYISRLLLVGEKLVSISAQREVKLWDVRNQRCMLTLDVEALMGGAKVTAAALEAKSMSVIFAGRRLFAFQLAQPVQQSTSGRTHDRPVVQALYNRQFHQFLTVDTREVKLWDADTGRQLVSFPVVRGDKGGNEVTTATFDASMRRLITGDHEGKELCVWNFNSGALLGRMVKTTPAPPPQKPVDAPLPTPGRVRAPAGRARRSRPEGEPHVHGGTEIPAGSGPAAPIQGGSSGGDAAATGMGDGPNLPGGPDTAPQGRAEPRAIHPALLRLQSGGSESPLSAAQGHAQRSGRRQSIRSQVADLAKMAAASPTPHSGEGSADTDVDSLSTATEEVLETAVGAEAADRLLAPAKAEKRVRKREVTSIAHSSHRAPAAPGEQAQLTQFVLCSGWDRNIHVWLDEAEGDGQREVPSRGNHHTFPFDPTHGHTRDVTCMCTFPPNGLATGDRAGSVRLWNASSGDPVAAVQCSAEAEALAYVGQASTLVVGLSDGSLSFIDVLGGGEFGVLRCAHAAPSTAIMRVTADPSGDYLVTADNRGGVTVWTLDVEGMNAARTGQAGTGEDEHSADVAALDRLGARVKTQARVLGVRSASRRGRSGDTAVESALQHIELPSTPPVGTFVGVFSFWMAHDDAVTEAAWVENGSVLDVHLLTSGLDGYVKLWTLNGGLVGVLGHSDGWNLNDRDTFRAPSPDMQVTRRRRRVWSLDQGPTSPKSSSSRSSRTPSRQQPLSRSKALQRTLEAQHRPAYVPTRRPPLRRGRNRPTPLMGRVAAVLDSAGEFTASRKRPAPGEVWVRYNDETADMIGMITVTRVDERQNLVAGWDGLAWSRDSKPDTELFLGDFVRDRPLHPWRWSPELTRRVGCILSDSESPTLYKVLFAARQGARITEASTEVTPARKGRGRGVLQRRGSLAAGGTESGLGLLRRRSDRSPSPRAGASGTPRSAGRASRGSSTGGRESGSPTPGDADAREQENPVPKDVHEECVVVDLDFREHKLVELAPGERYPRSMAPLRKAAARILAAHRARGLRRLAVEERKALEAERRDGRGEDQRGAKSATTTTHVPLHRGESFQVGVEMAAAHGLEVMTGGAARRAASRSRPQGEEDAGEGPKVPPLPLLSRQDTIPRWGKVNAGSVSARLPVEPERRRPARTGKAPSLATEALITHRYEEQARRRSEGVESSDGSEAPGSRTPSITAQYAMLQLASRAAQARGRGVAGHTGPMNGLTVHGIEDLPRSVKDVRAQWTSRRGADEGMARDAKGKGANAPRPPPSAKLGGRPQSRGRIISGGPTGPGAQ